MESQAALGGRVPGGPLFMHELLAGLPDGATVLDLGCGQGSFRYEEHARLSIHAVDTQRPATPFPPSISFRVGDAGHLDFPDGFFGLVVANFVLEHCPDLASALAEAARVTAIGGLVHLSLPDARGFEDHLYRALFAGGGHLQRPTFESVVATAYRSTTLKLVRFADWPAGFTFLEGREGLRRLVQTVADEVERSRGVDLRLGANNLYLFRKEESGGYRAVPWVCSYCGAGGRDGTSTCGNCGRENRWVPPTVGEAEVIDAEMRSFWKHYPHTAPAPPAGCCPTVPARLRGLLARLLWRLRR